MPNTQLPNNLSFFFGQTFIVRYFLLVHHLFLVYFFFFFLCFPSFRVFFLFSVFFHCFSFWLLWRHSLVCSQDIYTNNIIHIFAQNGMTFRPYTSTDRCRLVCMCTKIKAHQNITHFNIVDFIHCSLRFRFSCVVWNESSGCESERMILSYGNTDVQIQPLVFI